MKDAISARHDQALAGLSSHACRDRKRQILEYVDEERAVGGEALLRAAEGTVCDRAHPMSYADLVQSGIFTQTATGEWTLSSAGHQWLMEYGDESPDWRGSGARSGQPLREWQVEALDAWALHGRHGVVQAVTGAGKSRVGIEAVREALRDEYSVIICVPTIELVAQWLRALKSSGIPGADRFGGPVGSSFATHRVLVGTVQSLYQSPPTRTDGRVLLVADECHRYGSARWSKVLQPSYRRRLGLTATFERNDDGLKTLLDYFGGGPVFDIDFARAISDGVIARYDVKLCAVDLDGRERSAYDEADRVLTKARTQLTRAGVQLEPFGVFMHEVTQLADIQRAHPMGDVARRYLKAFSERVDIVANASAKPAMLARLGSMVRRSQGTLIFTRRVATTESLVSVLRDNGIKASALHSQHTRTERTQRLSDLRFGKLKALVAPTVLDEGVDVPDVTLAVVMGGSKSRRQMIQRMGRVLRLKRDGGKATFVVIYARDTMEDLEQGRGVEGCLDLIIATADSVEQIDHVRGSGPRDASASTGAEADVAADIDQPGTADAPPDHRPQPGSLVGTSMPESSERVELSESLGEGEPPRGRDDQETVVDAANSQTSPRGDDIVGRLERLADLWSRGLLTDLEFAAAKAKVLQGS